MLAELAHVQRHLQAPRTRASQPDGHACAAATRAAPRSNDAMIAITNNPSAPRQSSRRTTTLLLPSSALAQVSALFPRARPENSGARRRAAPPAAHPPRWRHGRRGNLRALVRGRQAARQPAVRRFRQMPVLIEFTGRPMPRVATAHGLQRRAKGCKRGQPAERRDTEPGNAGQQREEQWPGVFRDQPQADPARRCRRRSRRPSSWPWPTQPAPAPGSAWPGRRRRCAPPPHQTPPPLPSPGAPAASATGRRRPTRCATAPRRRHRAERLHGQNRPARPAPSWIAG